MMQEDFLLKARIKYGDRYDYSKVIIKNNKAKVEIICKEHGSFFQSPNGHLKSSQGCKLCSIAVTAKKKSYSMSDFLFLSHKKHGDKYDYSLVKFDKLTDVVIIICPDHGEIRQKASSHIKHGGICCRTDCRKTPIQDIIDKANKVHQNKYDYSMFTVYKNNRQAINIICPKHGIFIKYVHSHLKGEGCQKCNKEEAQRTSLHNFIEKSNIIHNNFYDYSLVVDYGSDKKIKIICPIHGAFNQIGWQHQGGNKCPKCAKANRKLTLESFLNQARAAHGEKYDYSEVNLDFVFNKIKIICYKHGPFFQSVASHIYSKSGCPNCSKIISRCETEWLDYLKIPTEYRNKQLVANNKIFFPDGYDPKTNTVYEYYGDYWHGNLSVYGPEKVNKLNKMKFIDLYNRTLKREIFLKEAGFIIVSIWESDWKKLKNETK